MTNNVDDNHKLKPTLQLKLLNAAGKMQLVLGIYGTILCAERKGETADCSLSVAALGYSFLSTPIENAVVRGMPRNMKVANLKLGVKYTAILARGLAGAVSGLFDVIDIARS